MAGSKIKPEISFLAGVAPEQIAIPTTVYAVGDETGTQEAGIIGENVADLTSAAFNCAVVLHPTVNTIFDGFGAVIADIVIKIVSVIALGAGIGCCALSAADEGFRAVLANSVCVEEETGDAALAGISAVAFLAVG